MQQLWCKELNDQKNITLAFTYSVETSTPATLNLSASNEYQVYSNGDLVAYGPIRSAHGLSHTRSYPLTAKGGRIYVAVLVCGAQINSFDKVDEQPFFATEIVSEGKVIASSEDFKAFRMTDRKQKVQRYSYQRVFAESYVLDLDRANLLEGRAHGFPSVKLSPVSANKLIGHCEISEPDYHFLPSTAYEKGSAFIDESREVYRDRSLTGIGCAPCFKRFEMDELEEILSDEAGKIVCRPESGKIDGNIKKAAYIAYKLDINSTGMFSFTAKVKEKATAYLLFDEIVTETENEGLFVDISRLQCCNVIKYVLSEGEHRLISFAPYTAKYIRLVVLEGEMEVDSFGMISYENPDDKLAFTCDDEDLNAVIQAARASFRQNAVDVLTDCPSRERAGWLCDGYFTSRAERLMTGDNKVERNFLDCFLNCNDLPGAKGMLPMCYPSDHPDGVYIPNWAMWFIVELHDYLDRTSDRAFADKCKDKVYGVIDFLDKFINSDGLLEDLESWIFVEWSKANDFVQGVNFPSSMMYALALKCTGEMYGDASLIARYESMRETIIRLSFNGEFFIDQALRSENGELVLTDNISETCQYYALWTGIATKESHPALHDTMLKEFSTRDPETEHPEVHPSNAFIGRLIRMDYYLGHGEYETVLHEAKNYYLPMAKRTGTLWEHLTTSASCNHGFTSYIANIIIEAYNALNK